LLVRGLVNVGVNYDELGDGTAWKSSSYGTVGVTAAR
jgi:hypothetical protein